MNDFVIDEGVLISYNGQSDYIEIPEGVHTIAQGAFYEKTFKEIVIPRSVETINSSAFVDCNNLRTIYTYSQCSSNILYFSNHYGTTESLPIICCHSIENDYKKEKYVVDNQSGLPTCIKCELNLNIDLFAEQDNSFWFQKFCVTKNGLFYYHITKEYCLKPSYKTVRETHYYWLKKSKINYVAIKKASLFTSGCLTVHLKKPWADKGKLECEFARNCNIQVFELLKILEDNGIKVVNE